MSALQQRLALLVLFALTAAGCASARSDANPISPTSTSSASASPQSAAPAPFLGTFYASQGHAHLAPGEPDDFLYNSDPPTSGPHRELFTDTFISPQPLPAYVQVHLLEHGNVLLQYNCNCPNTAAALGSIAMEYDKHLMTTGALQPSVSDVQNGEEQGFAVIVAPYPHMKSTIALTAWTRFATLPTVDKQKITAFINAYLHNQGNAAQ